MINIPTELLRTLVTVVDIRSFTKAAHILGVTQPAVSAQIKRLQLLLGTDIFDKSAPGVMLTPVGEMIVDQARRLLSVNDSILGLTSPRTLSRTIRIGVPGDYVSPYLPWALAQFRTHRPELRFNVRTGYFDAMLRDLRQGDIDLFVGMSPTTSREARHQWPEEVVWVHNASALRAFDASAPVALVCYAEECALHRVAVDALSKAGRSHEIVYVSESTSSLAAAIDAGLGIMALTRSRVAAAGLSVWEDAPFPKPATLFCGTHVREAGDNDAIDQLADAIASALNPESNPALRGRLGAVAVF